MENLVEESVDTHVEDFQDGQFLTFTLGKQTYGIEIRNVTEIIGIQKITDLPDLPDYVKGVINLRGKVIPVLDVRLRFGMEERSYDERTCIIVININDSSVGMVVDTVSEVINIPDENVEPPPKVNKKTNGNVFVKGLGKVEEEVYILLDTQKLLFEEELEALKCSIEE